MQWIRVYSIPADITVKRKFWKGEEIWVKTEKVKFLQVFFYLHLSV